MRIHLTIPPDEVARVRSLSMARNEKEARFGAMTYGGVCGSHEAHFVGMLAEWAVAKDAGVAVDERIFALHGDDGIDLVLPKYGKTSIKANQTSSDSYLRVPASQIRKGAETFVLCIVVGCEDGESAVVSVAGWATRSQVKSAPTWKWVENGPLNHNLPERSLRLWHPDGCMKPSSKCFRCSWEPVKPMGCSWCRKYFCYDCYWEHPHPKQIGLVA